jgi:choline dehydrogenase-like flavoprotein
LHVLCEASVLSVKLEGNTAVGVNFSHNSQTYSVCVKREVVVSCGALQTPQILELSGIGDPDVLKAAGVECKIENKAVGNNFQDHPLTMFTWELTPNNPTLEVIYIPEVMEDAMKQLAEKQGGPLTAVSSTQGFLSYKLFATDDEQASIIKSIEDSLPNVSPFQRKQYERTIEHLKDDKSANLQIVVVCHGGNPEEGCQDQSKLFPPVKPGEPMSITAAVCLQYPLSRGSVHIKTSNVSDQPEIDPGFLRHPADAAVLAAGVKMLSKITDSKAMEGKIAQRTFPKDLELDLTDTKQAEAAVKELVMSEYHPAGSCAVGDALDSKMRVKGVKNLRVADASVFPNHVSGNCVSSVYAVAEKAADLIKADWEYAALSSKGADAV